jgi:hypothetical protein
MERDELKIWIEQLPTPLFSSAVTVAMSGIHGQGLHAVRDIQPGEILVVDRGVEVDGVLIRQVVEQLNYKNFLCIDWDRYLLDGPVNGGAYINHSCEPRAALANERTIVAISKIAADAEIFLDYATFVAKPEWQMECACGSTRCRKIVTGRDHERPDFRDRMGRWFSPYLKKYWKIEEKTHNKTMVGTANADPH